MLRIRWILPAAALVWSCGAIAQSASIVAAYAPTIGLSDSELFQAERSGHKDPQTATLLLMLADRYQAQSRYPEAERLYTRSLAMFEETMGARHPNVGAAAHKLAQLHYAQAAYASAVPYYRRALSVFERSLGADHANVSELLIELAGCYQLQGRFAEAEAQYKRAIAVLAKKGTDERSLEIAQNGLATVYQAQGRVNEAGVTAAPSVRNLTTHYGPVVLRQRAR